MNGDTRATGAGDILVVDDNPATRYATSRVLKAAGFQVREAATGNEALALADEQVAGVVLDVHLPDVNGFEVCSRLRARPATARLPIIHLSAAYIGDHDKVRGLHSGADAYMTHPAEPDLLVATLQALIRARTAEEGMRRSEARFRAIYDLAPSGIGLIDGEGRFVSANPALLAFLERDAAAVEGHRLAEFVPEAWAARIPSLLDESRRGAWHGEFPLQAAGGGIVRLAWDVSTHVEPGLVLAIATDIADRLALSEQREALLETEQAARALAEGLNRSKDEFIAVLSHELRTPLNAILSWVHVLKRLDINPAIARGLASIERNANIQTRLVSDILDVSRMDLGKLRLDLEPVDAAELLTSSVNALSASMSDKALQVSVDVSTVTQPVTADASRLQQVVWNLLTNAIKFSRHGGTIRVIGRQDEHGFTLSVDDEGEGIEPDFLPTMFDRFTQGDSGSSRQHGGLGLGLSIVRHLVELHGGTVEAHSGGLGRGARFVATFPRREAPAERLQDSVFGALVDRSIPAAHKELEGLTVLIVEDDLEAREVLQLILGERGARVVPAGSYDEGLTRLTAQPRPDVLVSDVGMPGRDGHDLVREIRRRERDGAAHCPAIALTAFARPEDKRLALAAGFDAHVGKPLRPAELMATILRVVEAAANAQAGPTAAPTGTTPPP